MQLGWIEPGGEWSQMQLEGEQTGHVLRGLHVILSSVEALADMLGQGGISAVQSPDMTSLTRIRGLLLRKQIVGRRRGSW